MCALLVLENGSDAPMLFSPQNLLVRAMDTKEQFEQESVLRSDFCCEQVGF